MTVALFIVVVAWIGYKAFTTCEWTLNLWLFSNGIFLWWFYDFGPASVWAYVLPCTFNLILAFMITSSRFLSKTAYFALIGTILAAIINLLFVPLYHLYVPARFYEYAMLIPLAATLIGFFGGKHGHYKRDSSEFYSYSFAWARNRFAYHQTA